MKTNKSQNLGVVSPLARACAWCRKSIPEDQEVVGFGAKARPGADLGRDSGGFLEILLVLEGKHIPAMVVRPGSPASRAGHDLYFMACSDECATTLRAALNEEVRLGHALLG